MEQEEEWLLGIFPWLLGAFHYNIWLVASKLPFAVIFVGFKIVGNSEPGFDNWFSKCCVVFVNTHYICSLLTHDLSPDVWKIWTVLHLKVTEWLGLLESVARQIAPIIQTTQYMLAIIGMHVIKWTIKQEL